MSEIQTAAPMMNRRTPQQLALSPRSELRAWQTERLQSMLRAVKTSNPFYSDKWKRAGVDLSDTAISSLRIPQDLGRLPLTTKSEFGDDHRLHPPFGSNLTFATETYTRMHQTSGTTGDPVRWLDTPDSWQWVLGCWDQIFEMAEVGRGDRVGFPFSFGPFLGFWAAFEGAARRGCLCLPGGGMSSEERLRFLIENRATVVCCTPTYALRLAEVAADFRIDLKSSAVTKLIVAGEPGGNIPAVRERIQDAWAARVIDHWGMTEVGPLATECVEQPDGLHLLETECIAEIIDPATGESFDLDSAIAAGSQPNAAPIRGELVITNLGRVGSPAIRYRTGDQVELDPRPCACGRNLLRLNGGILGRLDDMLTIRGNNVFPSAIEAILREFPEVLEFSLNMATRETMPQLVIEIETTFGVPDIEEADGMWDLMDRVENAIHERLHFRPEVIPVEPHSLPRFELKARRLRRKR